MKHANVIEVRKVPASQDQSAADTSGDETTARIERLLGRYPATTDADNAEILRFLAAGPLREVGRIAGSDEFGPAVAAFRRDHRRLFRLKPKEAVLFLCFTVGPVMAFAWQYLG